MDALTGERTDNPVGYPLIDVTSSALNVPRPWQNEINRHRVGAMYFGANFGTIEIDWSAADPVIAFRIRDVNGQAVLAHTTRLSALRASRRTCSERTEPDRRRGT